MITQMAQTLKQWIILNLSQTVANLKSLPLWGKMPRMTTCLQLLLMIVMSPVHLMMIPMKKIHPMKKEKLAAANDDTKITHDVSDRMEVEIKKI